MTTPPPPPTRRILTAEQILALPLDPYTNDIGAESIREYLVSLLIRVWDREESFSGKRPFGNSGWKYALYHALVLAGAVAGTIDRQTDDDRSEEYVDVSIDPEAIPQADRLILDAIKSMLPEDDAENDEDDDA